MKLQTSLLAFALSVASALPLAAQVSWEGSASGPAGGSVSVTGSGGYDPATGRNKTSVYTTGNGETVTRSRSADCIANGNGTANCSKTVEGGRGTRIVERGIGGGQASKSVTRIGPNGGTSSRWINITR